MPWLRSEDAALYPCFSTAWYPCHMTVTDCNRMIGWSRDNAERLTAGAMYVLQWKGVVSGALAS